MKTGNGFMVEIMRRSIENKDSLPECVFCEYGDRDECILLASLCRELQRDAGDNNPFYLSCRTACLLLGLEKKRIPQVGRWLSYFEADGILELLTKGCTTFTENANGKIVQEKNASVWRYVLEDDSL